jgi:hypothetical protein
VSTPNPIPNIEELFEENDGLITACMKFDEAWPISRKIPEFLKFFFMKYSFLLKGVVRQMTNIEIGDFPVGHLHDFKECIVRNLVDIPTISNLIVILAICILKLTNVSNSKFQQQFQPILQHIFEEILGTVISAPSIKYLTEQFRNVTDFWVPRPAFVGTKCGVSFSLYKLLFLLLSWTKLRDRMVSREINNQPVLFYKVSMDARARKYHHTNVIVEDLNVSGLTNSKEMLWSVGHYKCDDSAPEMKELLRPTTREIERINCCGTRDPFYSGRFTRAIFICMPN